MHRQLARLYPGRSSGQLWRMEGFTLMIGLASLVATIWLYIIIPKGFLPPQDTGLITAVTEAGQEISFSEMQKLQAKVVDAIRQDPDVTGVVSIAGVIANALLGTFLDKTGIRKSMRARGSYVFICGLFFGIWTWFTVVQVSTARAQRTP